MSRLAKKPISIPEKVGVEIKNSFIEIKGSKGILKKKIPPSLILDLKGNALFCRTKNIEDPSERAILGTMVRIIKNMIWGVENNFKKGLKLVGVGYRANVEGDKLILYLGFSHPITFQIPKDIEIKVDKDIVWIEGPSKELVGETAARIRRLRPPEPYKGRGVRYIDEIVRHKAGKKATATAG
jgi:large subunit ribosomal protein L6